MTTEMKSYLISQIHSENIFPEIQRTAEIIVETQAIDGVSSISAVPTELLWGAASHSFKFRREKKEVFFQQVAQNKDKKFG